MIYSNPFLCDFEDDEGKKLLFLTYDNHLMANSLSYCAFIFLFWNFVPKNCIKCKIDTANEM